MLIINALVTPICLFFAARAIAKEINKYNRAEKITKILANVVNLLFFYKDTKFE